MEFVNKILHGDWIYILKMLPDGVFHCCVTSPPYWGQRSYSWGGDGSCYDESRKATIHPEWRDFDDVLQVCVKCGARRPIFGLEKTPGEHIEKLVEGLREVRRVLRDDGVVFLNYSDKYANDEKWGGKSGNKNDTSSAGGYPRDQQITGQKQGNLLLLPARIALALQADGWYVRQKIIWAKAISLAGNHCPNCGKALYYNIDLGTNLLGEPVTKTINKKYSGSTMPESVSGTYWQPHRVKTKKGGTHGDPMVNNRMSQSCGRIGSDFPVAQWADCPRCEKCQAEGGLILRQGSGRCTSAYEEILMLTKTDRYFWDTEAVREAISPSSLERIQQPNFRNQTGGDKDYGKTVNRNRSARNALENFADNPSGRNLRNIWAVPQDIQDIFWEWYEANAGYLSDVWAINPKAYKEAHYATYPPKLVETYIKASTSAKGVCPKCGKPWARIINTNYTKHRPSGGKTSRMERGNRIHDGGCGNWGTFGTNLRRQDLTLGWKPTCRCNAGEPVPALVLDPFFGSGTTDMVAAQLGRQWTGIEINPEYIYNQAQWRVKEGETGMRKQEARNQQALPFESSIENRQSTI